MVDAIDGLKKLREPFPENQISKLPKETKQQTEARKNDMKLGIRCKVCGGWHHKDAVHLDYVGHAALTDRLLDADPGWNWEPASFTAEGLPAFDRSGGLWIKLTVCGMTRIGYGHADGKSGGDAIKEVIGDALRNAAMRFGAALDLWHKGDLHAHEGDDEAPPQKTPKDKPKPAAQTPFDSDPDEVLSDLRRAAMNGTDEIRKAWGMLSPAEKERLKPHLAELRNAAAQADDAASGQEAA